MVCCFDYIIYGQGFITNAYSVGFKNIASLVVREPTSLDMIGIIC